MMAASGKRGRENPSPGLLLFCLALMMPGVGINAVFVALAIPAMAPYGVQGLVVAGLAGSLLGIFPALWLARRIHEGLSNDRS